MHPILVMIPYEIGVGFAIGRLIVAFHEMALRMTGSPDDVHFAFATIGGQSRSLPAGFSNLLEFNHGKHSADDVERFVSYVKHHRIHTIFALDMRVDAPYLPAARRAGVRQVVSYWGASMSSIVPWKYPLKRLEVAMTRSKPDLFIFESHAMRRQAVFGRGVAESSTAVVRTGVDASKFRPMPELQHLVYEAFSIPMHRRIIVFMGHLHERKGVQVLLRAAADLRNRDDIHFLFLGNRAGDTDKFGPVTGNVTFGGYHSDVPAILAGCYAGCIPSTGWDSYPMSSLEMQACGLPVIVSDLQGCPETVDHNTGIVVPAGNHIALTEAVRSLVDAPERRARMSGAARTRIEHSLTTSHQVNALVQAMSRVTMGFSPASTGSTGALHRAIMYERACEEATERHFGMYDAELVQARAEVKRLSDQEGA